MRPTRLGPLRTRPLDSVPCLKKGEELLGLHGPRYRSTEMSDMRVPPRFWRMNQSRICMS